MEFLSYGIQCPQPLQALVCPPQRFILGKRHINAGICNLREEAAQTPVRPSPGFLPPAT